MFMGNFIIISCYTAFFTTLGANGIGHSLISSKSQNILAETIGPPVLHFVTEWFWFSIGCATFQIYARPWISVHTGSVRRSSLKHLEQCVVLKSLNFSNEAWVITLHIILWGIFNKTLHVSVLKHLFLAL